MIETGEQRPAVIGDYGFVHCFPLFECYQKVIEIIYLNLYSLRHNKIIKSPFVMFECSEPATEKCSHERESGHHIGWSTIVVRSYTLMWSVLVAFLLHLCKWIRMWSHTYNMIICLCFLQGFVIALFAIVIATFSTGINSQSFQVQFSTTRDRKSTYSMKFDVIWEIVVLTNIIRKKGRWVHKLIK